MKIFPPLSEMLWPPGYGLTDMLRRYRHLLYAATGFAAMLVAWPYARPAPQPTVVTANTDAGRSVERAQLEIDNKKCSTLLREGLNTPTVEESCGSKSMRMRAGASIAKDAALARGDPPSRDGTLTAADRAIAAPPPLRSTVWDDREEDDKEELTVPPLALSPTTN